MLGANAVTEAPLATSFRKQGHGLSRNALLATLEAQMLSGGGFYAHLVNVDTHSMGQVLAHLIAERRELGGLRRNNAIDIDDIETEFAHVVRNARQQHHGIGARIRRVGIGEQFADIARTRSAEQRVGDGMRKHVGIGMPQKPLMMRNVDTTQNKFAALRECVHIEAEAHAHIHSVRHE